MADDIEIGVTANTEDASSSLMSLADGIMIAFGSKIVDAIGSAFTFVTDQLSEFVGMAAEAEEVGALFASTLAGSPLAEYGTELEDLAQHLQSVTRFEDEAILSAETVILRYNEIGHDVFPRVTATSLDLAESMKLTAEGGAQMLGRALSDIANGSLSALKRTRLLDQATLDAAEAMAKAGDATGAQTLILDALDSKIGNVAETMAGTFNGAWQKFGITIDNIKEDLGGKLLPLFTPLIQKFQILAEKYAPLLADMFDKFLVPAITALVDVITPLIDIALPQLMDWLQGLVQPTDFLLNAINPLGDGFKKLYDDFMSADWGALAVDFGKFLGDIVNQIADWFNNIDWEQVGKFLSDGFWLVLEFLGNFIKETDWAKIYNDIQDGFIEFLDGFDWALAGAAVREFVVTVAQTLADFMMNADFGKTWGPIANSFLEFMGGFIGVDWNKSWKELTDNFGLLMGVLPQYMEQQLDKVKRTVDTFLPNIVLTFQAKFNEILLSVSLIMIQMTSSIYLKIEEIKTNFALGVTNWLAAIGDKLGEFLTMGEALINNIKNGVTNAWTNLVSLITTNMDSIITTVRTKINQFTNIGGSIVDNIRNGITNNWASFSTWISGKIQEIIDGLLAAIGLPNGGTGGANNVTPPTIPGVGGNSINGGNGSAPGMPPTSGAATTYNFGPVTQMFQGKPNTSIYGAG